ncbi:MAG TPA: DoxX family protein [Chthoniobacteraceae bacterium]|jgi:putative oxidoreductase|nr:DoxX family protein [Chthoniobacteraceae bacterium]
MVLTSLTRFRDWGLLFLRVALGVFYIYAHGWHKLAAGARYWGELGEAVRYVGIHFAYPFWGLMAALAETLGCVMLILGFCFRPGCILLFCTLFVASAKLLHTHAGLEAASHPIELAILFFALIFIGPGKYSIDRS